jgi:hypothetical protein
VKSSFGGTQYVHPTRINVGAIRRGVNVVEDLRDDEARIVIDANGQSKQRWRR